MCHSHPSCCEGDTEAGHSSMHISGIVLRKEGWLIGVPAVHNMAFTASGGNLELSTGAQGFVEHRLKLQILPQRVQAEFRQVNP